MKKKHQACDVNLIEDKNDISADWKAEISNDLKATIKQSPKGNNLSYEPISVRRQGRPTRAGMVEVGSVKIVEATLKLLRSMPKSEITRKRIAETASINPALVTYYFPNQSILLLSCIDPILDEYIKNLYIVIESKIHHSDHIKNLISLFLMFNRENSVLLDNYLILVTTDPNLIQRQEKITLIYHDILKFLDILIEAEGWISLEPTWLVFAVWGMCKSIAQPPVLPVEMSSSLSDDDLVMQQTEKVLSLLKSGISKRNSDL